MCTETQSFYTDMIFLYVDDANFHTKTGDCIRKFITHHQILYSLKCLLWWSCVIPWDTRYTWTIQWFHCNSSGIWCIQNEIERNPLWLSWTGTPSVSWFCLSLYFWFSILGMNWMPCDVQDVLWIKLSIINDI